MPSAGTVVVTVADLASRWCSILGATRRERLYEISLDAFTLTDVCHVKDRTVSQQRQSDAGVSGRLQMLQEDISVPPFGLPGEQFCSVHSCRHEC